MGLDLSWDFEWKVCWEWGPEFPEGPSQKSSVFSGLHMRGA